MRRIIIAAILTLATACSGFDNRFTNTTPIPEIPVPEIEENFVEKKLNDNPRSLKISLTLSNPDDLKIKSGQLVKAGEILSDRVGERRSLLERKKLLEISLEEVSRTISAPTKPLQLPEMPQLPKADFTKEQVAIEKAKLSLDEKAQIVAQQEELIFSLQNSQVNNDVVLHEQAKLNIAKLNYLKSKVDLDSALAQLSSVQADRKYQEYRHNLEYQNRLLELQRQQNNYEFANSRYVEQVKEQEFRKASINTQLATIDEKLDTLVAVTSPFDGTIRKINYESQNNNFIVAVATLDVASESSNDSASLSQSISRLPTTIAGISHGKF